MGPLAEVLVGLVAGVGWLWISSIAPPFWMDGQVGGG
jgi:hypothetical protein